MTTDSTDTPAFADGGILVTNEAIESGSCKLRLLDVREVILEQPALGRVVRVLAYAAFGLALLAVLGWFGVGSYTGSESLPGFAVIFLGGISGGLAAANHFVIKSHLFAVTTTGRVLIAKGRLSLLESAKMAVAKQLRAPGPNRP